MWLFSYLLDFLFPLRDIERLVCETTPAAFLAHLSPVLVNASVPGTIALLPFRVPLVRAVIHEAKYRGSSHALALLGEALGEYLLELSAEEMSLSSGKRMAIIPIPLSPERYRERGFNQCEEIAKRIPGLTIPLLTNALMRTKNTEHQTRLSGKARRENARGAFGTPGILDPTLLYIVVDDVITTGATLQSAIDALRAAGAARILPIALAH